MNRYVKKILILGGITVVLFVGILIYTLGIFPPQKSSVSEPNNTPTQPVIISSPIQKESALKIISATPVDSATEVPVTTALTIVMNRSFVSGDIIFAVNPSFLYDESVSENTVTMTPKSPLQSGTTYTYAIKIKSTSIPSAAYSFTTAGRSNGFAPDTQPRTNSTAK